MRSSRGSPSPSRSRVWTRQARAAPFAAGLDARHYNVIPVAAPTDEERAQPYLWRFWRHLPRKGRVTIYDRTWYGRVLVERIEGFCAEADWMRAYTEINDFEEQLERAFDKL
jgi:polyphosphate kinase 2 (PPK2 family)